jgi:hypothetical protein
LLTTQRPLSASLPLVLDLDGTLIRTDTFHEMMIYLLTQKPWILFRLPVWFLKGRPYVKARLVEHTDMSVDLLPYNKYLLSFAQKEAEQGRLLVLATGTDQRLAQKISDHLGIFQDVIGSDGMINMTGQQKRQALLDRFGKHGFDYAGDSSIDTFVWQVSRKALVVCPKWGVLKKARALKNAEHLQYFPRNQKRVIALFLALRPLFWVFNLMASTVSFFVGLSFLSTGLLILSDLFVVEQERKEQYKKKSVFAEGDLHLMTAFTLAPLFIILSLFFLLSMPGGGFYIGGYSLLFIGLDRFTRSTAQPLRWTLLGLFQTFAALMSGV